MRSVVFCGVNIPFPSEKASLLQFRGEQLTAFGGEVEEKEIFFESDRLAGVQRNDAPDAGLIGVTPRWRVPAERGVCGRLSGPFAENFPGFSLKMSFFAPNHLILRKKGV